MSDLDQKVREMGGAGAAIYHLSKATPIRFFYTNHRGEFGVRRAIPLHVYWGTSAHHGGGEVFLWLMYAFDVEKWAFREFDLSQCTFTDADRTAKVAQAEAWEPVAAEKAHDGD